jgi:hypothetical protein
MREAYIFLILIILKILPVTAVETLKPKWEKVLDSVLG